MLGFLAQEGSRAGSYSTLSTARSAISLISSTGIRNHPFFKRFSKVFNVEKPQRPRYDCVWDPESVIAKLAVLFPHEPLSMDIISKKLAMLLALGTGQRCQTLAAIKISQISLEANRVLIRLPDKLKTSGPGRSQPLLTLPRFRDQKELCLVSLLSRYLSRTETLRSQECDSLFITLKRPHKAASSQTIAR